MFEKEAEEYYNDVTVGTFQESIEFFEDAVMTAYRDGAEFGYNKANEWHYVKDGDLPKEFGKPYLCYVNEHFEVGYFTAYKEQPWHFDEYYPDNEDVIAWCEIPTFAKE